MKEYKHIRLKERKSIYMSLQCGLSIDHIAKKLNRSRSTIYRELARNKEKNYIYLIQQIKLMCQRFSRQLAKLFFA